MASSACGGPLMTSCESVMLVTSMPLAVSVAAITPTYASSLCSVQVLWSWGLLLMLTTPWPAAVRSICIAAFFQISG